MIYDKRGGIKNMYQIHQNFGVKLSNLEPDIPPELPTRFPSFAASVCGRKGIQVQLGYLPSFCRLSIHQFGNTAMRSLK